MSDNFSFVRGDTCRVKTKIKSDLAITKDDISTIFVTCRKTPYKKSPIIFQKTIDDVEIEDNYIKATFEPKDTENLDYGAYCFDIEVTFKVGIKCSKYATFTLTEEATIGEKVGD